MYYVKVSHILWHSILSLHYINVIYHNNISDNNDELLHLAFVQYVFDGDEHSVIPRPHGNSKKVASYVRTMPSTLQRLRKVAVNLTPKFAICEMSGDIMTAASAGSLARNRQQVKDLRRRRDTNEVELVHSKKRDPLYSVMLMCKESQGKAVMLL